MYFTDAHDELRLHIRKFLATEVQPHLEEWEETTFPDFIFKRFGELGFLGLRYPPEDRGHKGYNLPVIEKGTPGFQVTRTLKKLGMRSSDTAELLFENCRVPVANLIGEEGEGFKNLMWELQGERMIAAAGAIAGATRIFEYTMDYAQNRQAFGQAISQFQVIKHRLVDMGTKIAAVQAFVYQTAAQWDRGEYPVREISQAKLLATQTACDVADDAIQILGGHGYMREFPVERAPGNARLRRIGAGSDAIMKEIIAKTYGL